MSPGAPPTTIHKRAALPCSSGTYNPKENWLNREPQLLIPASKGLLDPSFKSSHGNISRHCSAWHQLLNSYSTELWYADPALAFSPPQGMKGSYPGTIERFLLDRKINNWAVHCLCLSATLYYNLVSLEQHQVAHKLTLLRIYPVHFLESLYTPVTKTKNLRSTPVGWFFLNELWITLMDKGGLILFPEW